MSPRLDEIGGVVYTLTLMVTMNGFNPELYPHLADRSFEQSERQEIERRIEEARRELGELSARLKDIATLGMKDPAEDMPEQGVFDLMSDLLMTLIATGSTVEEEGGLKRSVLRRMADRIARQILYTRLTSTPVFHELLALTPWWLTRLPLDVVQRLRDIGLRYVLNGIVIPIQTVRRLFLESSTVYLGHCVCRSSGLVNDTTTDGKPFTMLSDAENVLMFQRLTSTWRASVDEGWQFEDRHPVAKLLTSMSADPRAMSDPLSLDRLFRELYPMWEFIPVHREFSPGWSRSMYLNNKAHALPPRVAVELANALYYSRGIMFSSMKLLDTQYTICSCPTPENSGGCILTNWYYRAAANESLIPNRSIHGQLTDQQGTVLPCNIFPARSHRPCLGCGCRHDERHPRDLGQGLEETDELYVRMERA